LQKLEALHDYVATNFRRESVVHVGRHQPGAAEVVRPAARLQG
jgi:hypothetical protein